MKRALPLASSEDLGQGWIFSSLIVSLSILATSCTEAVELGADITKGSASDPSDSTSHVQPTSYRAPKVPVVRDDAGLPVQTRDGWIRGVSLTNTDRFAGDYYSQQLNEQLTLYPSSFTDRIGLKQVVLCKDLTFDGSSCVAFADVEHGRLYMSINPGLLPAFIKRTIHHEVFHQVDFADDQKLESDLKWEALNPADFRYGYDAERLQADPESVRHDPTLNGFLNRYSTSSPAEDKAEIYAAMIVQPEQIKLRTARDSILQRKVERIRDMLDGIGRYAKILIDR